MDLFLKKIEIIKKTFTLYQNYCSNGVCSGKFRRFASVITSVNCQVYQILENYYGADQL